MRKFLPTLGELIDRLSIVQLKEVKIPQHKEEYAKEISDIVHDINEILKEKDRVDGEFIRAVVVVSQMNAHIWYNEDNARNGVDVGNKLLLTHGLNESETLQKIKSKNWMVVGKITKSIVLQQNLKIGKYRGSSRN